MMAHELLFKGLFVLMSLKNADAFLQVCLLEDVELAPASAKVSPQRGLCNQILQLEPKGAEEEMARERGERESTTSYLHFGNCAIAGHEQVDNRRFRL